MSVDANGNEQARARDRCGDGTGGDEPLVAIVLPTWNQRDALEFARTNGRLDLVDGQRLAMYLKGARISV